MKHRSIGLIIGLMTLALLGVIAMQYFFIRQSYILNAQLFDESVKAALNSVAAKAEKREVMQLADQQRENKEKWEREQRKLKEHIRINTEIEKLREKQSNLYVAFKREEEAIFEEFPFVLPIESNEFYETYLVDPRYKHLLRVNFESNASMNGGYHRNDNTVGLYAIKQVPLRKAKDDSARYFIPIVPENPYASAELKYAIKALAPRRDLKMADEIAKKEQQLKLLQASSLMDTIAVLSGKNPQLVQDFEAELELYKLPLNERIDVGYIKAELEKELAARGIPSAFNLEIRDRHSTLYAFANFGEGQPVSQHIYSTELFRADNQSSTGLLSVYFPNQSNILMGNNITAMLFSSVALLLVLLGCFAYTIFTILRQKKISEMKTDFINNMTHEFKTPVATIMIASESLKDPEIASDQRRSARLANIIYDENVRLGNHIERVLNIARLEKDSLKLELNAVDMNDLAQVVVDSMELQLIKHGAKVSMQLDATNAVVKGDELHLSNVLFNLVDNAIKYSKETPEITIKTKNVHKQLLITVADKGIGMNRDQLSKIFDQFYRIPTGNRHDVKGFGLGLSYVSDIVKRFGGKVQVKSEKDKGTTFEITLPLNG